MTRPTQREMAEPLKTYMGWLRGAANKIEELGYQVTIKIEENPWNKKK